MIQDLIFQFWLLLFKGGDEEMERHFKIIDHYYPHDEIWIVNESKLKADFRYLKAANLEELLAQMREQGYDVLEFKLPKNY